MIYNILPLFPVHSNHKADTVRMRIAQNVKPNLGTLFEPPTNVFKPEDPAIGRFLAFFIDTLLGVHIVVLTSSVKLPNLEHRSQIGTH